MRKAHWGRYARGCFTIEALEDAVVVEVSTPELADVVRLTSDYGRAGTSAPAQASLMGYRDSVGGIRPANLR
jgi:hypothetical protein